MAPSQSEATNREGPAPDGDVAVTPGELKLMMSVFRNTTRTGKPWIGGTVNWGTVSQELGLKAGKTARDRMSQVSKKFGLFEAEDPAPAADAAAAPAPKTKKADAAPKTKKADAAPKAKAKKGKGKRPAEDDEADDKPGNNDHGEGDTGDAGESGNAGNDGNDASDDNKEDTKKPRVKKSKRVKSE
ncbi:hypothetical protein SLS62_001182 [Diatrype stigma]|uniref:Uncharacterized protein n=1 Tax=Diatrype stigma TaxID=117547 RepID=A0AAN9YW91_9PEZI